MVLAKNIAQMAAQQANRGQRALRATGFTARQRASTILKIGVFRLPSQAIRQRSR
jgi:hypothetical protein